MSESNFVDHLKIYARSGKGGRGSVHFRREKYVPKGGPDGGDGGDGGNVILRGNRNCWTLLHLKFERHILAGHGENGSGRLSKGKNGEDRIIELPLGTVVFDSETGEFVAEIEHHEQEIVILHGGRGGKGNNFFKSATNQAPKYAQPGEPYQERRITLQLKLLADAGLVGFPNAGKSTLLSTLSAARPKIADYPFTTLEPSLGIVDVRGVNSFVMADIPGIIEGASEGKGLGLRFLRHIERNSIFIFLVPSDSADVGKEYEILLGELVKYNPDLLGKRRILAISKSDMLDDELRSAMLKELPETLPHVFISSFSKEGTETLKDLIWRELNGTIVHDPEPIVRRPIDVRTFGPEDDCLYDDFSEDEEDVKL
ncbi:MAG: GTPase ObgE [Dysgonamonadaceae bacterium]|jgi:GTP-binding protein|nr:GTPase ObgE [Dysgonamonadaceae bacterium]